MLNRSKADIRTRIKVPLSRCRVNKLATRANPGNHSRTKALFDIDRLSVRAFHTNRRSRRVTQLVASNEDLRRISAKAD
jgi:hypothetical protein